MYSDKAQPKWYLRVKNLVAGIRRLPSSVLEPEQSRIDPILDIGSCWEPCLYLNRVEVPFHFYSYSDSVNPF